MTTCRVSGEQPSIRYTSGGYTTETYKLEICFEKNNAFLAPYLHKRPEGSEGRKGRNG